MHRHETRRSFLRRGLIGTGGAVLAACARLFRDEVTWLDPIPMGTAPDPVDVRSFETSTPIKRVVYLIKENRTFDHLFGRFPGANGATVGVDRGVERTLTPATRGALARDIEHCYECAIECWNEGRMDGFNRNRAADAGASHSSSPRTCRPIGTGPTTSCCWTTSSPRPTGPRSRTTCSRSRRNPRACTRTRSRIAPSWRAGIARPGSSRPGAATRSRTPTWGRRMRTATSA